MTVSTYLGTRWVLSPALASVGCSICSITLSLLMCRRIWVVALRWLLLVVLAWIFRFGAVGNRTTRGGMRRLEEVAVEWIEVDITRE